MCSRNQHCFCRSCITQHLQNAKRCPTCSDELTVETLAEPQRMVKEVINELKIHCVYNNRGCQEIPQLQHLDLHEDSCGFTPVVCTNEGCGATVNKRDLIHHESEQCEYRKLKCHSCEEMKITLANMDKKIANMETNIATMQKPGKNIEIKIANVDKNMANIEEKMVTIETEIEKSNADVKTDIEAKFGAVNNEVKELKTTLTVSLDQIKDVLGRMEDKIKKTLE